VEISRRLRRRNGRAALELLAMIDDGNAHSNRVVMHILRTSLVIGRRRNFRNGNARRDRLLNILDQHVKAMILGNFRQITTSLVNVGSNQVAD
jgi:hypothetical protein